MAKQKAKVTEIKVRNPVAQYGLKINRCTKMVDRKKAAKRGESKHRESYC